MIFEFFLKLSLSLFFATTYGVLRSLDILGLGRTAEYVRI